MPSCTESQDGSWTLLMALAAIFFQDLTCQRSSLNLEFFVNDGTLKTNQTWTCSRTTLTSLAGRSLRINPNGMSMHITNPQVQHPKVSQCINNIRLTPQFGNPLFQELSAGCSDAPDIKHSASPSSEATGSDCKHFCHGLVFFQVF